MVKGKNMNGIMERLDRGVATDKWLDLFPFAYERHIAATVSDHVPLLFQISDYHQPNSKCRCSFKFENMWLEDEGCRQTVTASWEGVSVSNFTELAGIIERCGRKLVKWNKETYGILGYQIQAKRTELEKMQSKVQKIEDNVAIDNCRKQLMGLVQKEEILWRQRSKCLWLKEGDRNTKVFHTVASCRRRNNRVSRILDVDNQWYEQEEDIARVFLNYFKKIFTSSNPTSMETIFQAMESKIGDDDNANLLKEFTEEEIKVALDQMHPDRCQDLME